MKYIEQKLFVRVVRFFVMLKCLWILCKHCFMVSWHCRSGAVNRQLATDHLHQGGLELLDNVKATYNVVQSDTFKINTAKPTIFMSNHLSLFDLPLIVATMPGHIRVVIKKELTRIPFLGKAALASEQVIVDRKGNNRDFFYHNAKEKLSSGILLWIFPEGTRSRTGKLLDFKLGAFRLAQEIGAEIIPVYIHGTDRILAAGKSYPHLNQSIEIRIGEVIDTQLFKTQEKSIELLSKHVREALALLM